MEGRTLLTGDFGLVLSFGGAPPNPIGNADAAFNVATDPAGNVYVTGIIEGTVDFDPGPGVVNLSGGGSDDAYVAKYSPTGALVWARAWGGPDLEEAGGLALDGQGNVYIAGDFRATTDFDPGPGVFNLTAVDTQDVYLLKLNPAGNFVWAKQFGGVSPTHEFANSVSLDPFGNVYLSGFFSGSGDYDPGAGVATLTSAGGHDGFVVKLNSLGNFVWARSFGGAGQDLALANVADSSGNVHVSGRFRGTSDFDPGAAVANLVSAGGSDDAFVLKLNSAGNFVWARQAGSNGYDDARSVAVDPTGNVYVTGQFTGTVDFDPGPGVRNLISAGAGDIHTWKLSSFGNIVWAVRQGGAQHDAGYDVALDANGNVYTSGTFRGVADFDPGAGVFNLVAPAAAGDNMFVSKLSNNGDFVWARGFGGADPLDQAHAITVDSAGNVWAAGNFGQTVDFDPGAGVQNRTAAGVRDAFVLKLRQDDPDYGFAVRAGAAGSDRGNAVAADAAGNSYVTGRFQGAVDFDPGPGVVTLNSGAIGNSDVFVAKYSRTGTLLWARRAGAGGFDEGADVAVDSVGNVYVTGSFTGVVDFDPGAGVVNLAAAGQGIFVWKLTPFGALSWARGVTGVAGAFRSGQGIALDATGGSVHVTGAFSQTADFDPGAGVFNMTAAGAAGPTDAFVLKLGTAAGNFIWARRLGGVDSDGGRDIAVDSAGNVVTVGEFFATADFDPGAAVSNLTSFGSADVFVSKLNSAGNFVWARQLGGAVRDFGHGVAVDRFGQVHTTGNFTGVADFNPGAAVFNLASAGGNDAFVSKLSSGGLFQWAQRMGGAGEDAGREIAVDNAGHVYTTGHFTGVADFNPAAAVFNLASAGGSDVYVSRLNGLGNFVSARRMGGAGSDVGLGLALGASSSAVYTTGAFSSAPADFNPGPGVANLFSAGLEDMFLSKLIM